MNTSLSQIQGVMRILTSPAWKATGADRLSSVNVGQVLFLVAREWPWLTRGSGGCWRTPDPGLASCVRYQSGESFPALETVRVFVVEVELAKLLLSA